ncbi:amidase family protein [Erysipelothrix anatis]|uniref:amidase family protein n=1 Tax=Erysipelothrix anatis TaxID=2683713 RepID=UPI00140850B6|nr:amidase family protein [Erysipelothrix anatis]
MTRNVSSFALRTYQALGEKAVVEVNVQKIVDCEQRLNREETCYYVGVKNTNVIPIEFLEMLESHGYLMHTRDAMALNGRAIDLELVNPITGRYMTGSSSGTAINVFKGINDLGIGTDGGGSVLAPAAALNLYGFISPLICNDALSKYSRKSTDNITFQPSIGFMAREFEVLRDVVALTLPADNQASINVVVSTPDFEPYQQCLRIVQHHLDVSDYTNLRYINTDRSMMIDELRHFDFDTSVLITFEGPIDFIEYGDSLSGHYDALTTAKQSQSHKNYLKVINMLGLSAISIPTSQLSTSILMICKSDPTYIQAMIDFAQQIPFERSALESRYFTLQE